jgi:uncharacterized DUF497 family protein
MTIRCKFDKNKSDILAKNPKRGIGLLKIQEIFNNPYYEDFRSDNPEQYRAIGWVQDKLFSLVYEVRQDNEGEYYHLVTLWPSTKEEVKLYEKNS